ncbi:MAG TPA: hypothetical protein DCW42_05555, partial [Bacteroidetes bacterium]|nr:hypothetical protein [Bacteroidota bacterium]
MISIGIIAFSLLLFSCNNNENTKIPEPAPTQINKPEKKPELDSFITIKYHIIKFTSNSERKAFFADIAKKPNFNPGTMKLLNRKEWYLIQNSNTVIYPDTFITDLRAYSFFPVYYSEAAN